jgi:predicted thioesterase
MTTLAVPLTQSIRIVVDRPRTIDFLGEDCRVYATPAMGWDVEVACRDLVRGHLAAGQDTVGAQLEIEHVGASLLGAAVDIAVTLVGVEGRKLDYTWTVHEGAELVGRGRHRRVIIETEKLIARLRAKRA